MKIRNIKTGEIAITDDRTTYDETFWEEVRPIRDYRIGMDVETWDGAMRGKVKSINYAQRLICIQLDNSVGTYFASFEVFRPRAYQEQPTGSSESFDQYAEHFCDQDQIESLKKRIELLEEESDRLRGVIRRAQVLNGHLVHCIDDLINQG